MIRQSTIQTLCEEAGLDPTRVAYAEIRPHAVIFDVYSVNIYGEKMANPHTDVVITHWVRAAIG